MKWKIQGSHKSQATGHWYTKAERGSRRIYKYRDRLSRRGRCYIEQVKDGEELERKEVWAADIRACVSRIGLKMKPGLWLLIMVATA